MIVTVGLLILGEVVHENMKGCKDKSKKRPLRTCERSKGLWFFHEDDVKCLIKFIWLIYIRENDVERPYQTHLAHFHF